MLYFINRTGSFILPFFVLISTLIQDFCRVLFDEQKTVKNETGDSFKKSCDQDKDAVNNRGTKSKTSNINKNSKKALVKKNPIFFDFPTIYP